MFEIAPSRSGSVLAGRPVFDRGLSAAKTPSGGSTGNGGATPRRRRELTTPYTLPIGVVHGDEVRGVKGDGREQQKPPNERG